MPNPEQISWKVLVGNKYTKALHAAMLSSVGYMKTSSVRRIGDVAKGYFLVKYDREYVIEYIGRLVCRPFYHIGKEKVLELVDEAWENWYNNELTATERAMVAK